MRTSPLYFAVFFAASMSRRVVLPHPLGPMIATNSPGLKCPLHGSKTILRSPPRLAGRENVTSLNVMLAGGNANADLLM